MRDNPWPSIPRGLQHARRSLRSLVAQAKRSSSGSTPSPSPAPSPSVPSSRPRSLSLAPQQPPRASPSPRTPSTPSPATGYARSPSTTPTRAGGMTLPPQRPARRLPVVHSVRDYPEHLNPFRDDVDEDGSAVPPPLPGMEDDEPTLRPTQDKFGTWTVPRRRSHLNFEQTWSSREYPSTAATPPSPASRGHNGTAAPPRPPVGPRLAAGPSTSGAPTPAPRPPVKPRKKRKAPPPPPPPKAQQRLSSAVSLPQLSQSEGEALANAQPAVTQSQSQVSLACHQDDALSRSASPEDRVGSNPTGPSAPREAPSVEEPDEPPPASGSPVPIHEAGPTSTESLPETEAPEQDAANEERGQSTPPCEDERSGNDSPPAPPRQQDPLSGSPISQRSFRSSTPEAVIMAVEQAPREGGHEEHSPTPSPRSSTSRASSSPEPPLPPPPALSTSPGSSPQGSSPQGSSPHSSPSPLRAASPERLEPQSATSEECPSPPTPASPCSPTRSNEASPTAPTPSPPPPPASPESTARPHCPLAKPEEDADEEDGDAACREDLSEVIAPAASLITSPRPHLQV